MIQKYLKNYFLILSSLFVILTLVGIYKNYSPVPYMDMWDGYLDFYVKASDGDWNAWFAQHNEHRTVFSNLLFFIDIHLFGGKNIFLLIANFTLMASAAWLIIVIIKEIFIDLSEDNTSRYLPLIMGLFSIVMIFSWIQKENIIWGFQSQFFAAYFFPLLSFYLLVKSVDKNSIFLYITSLFVGVVSAGTMANGVMTLPILLLLSLLLKNNFIKSALIFVISLGIFYLYFNDYHAPGGHGSLLGTLLNHPKDFFQYIFAYLGGIFYYTFGRMSHLIPQFFGIVMIAASLFFTYVAVIKENTNQYYFVVLGFLLYYGGTAFGTAGGRAIFGIDQAFASRYTTPSLIAWSLLITLLFHYFKNNQIIVKSLLGFIVIISISLTVLELRAVKDNSDSLMDRKIGALALEMGIRDETYIKTIFPFVDWIVTMAREPSLRNISIFDYKDIKDVSLMIGQTINTLPKNNLIGHIDEITTILEDPNTLRLKGWIFDQDLKQIPKNLLIVNQNYKIIGYALVGYSRNDVGDRINKKALESGWIGYAFQSAITEKIYLVDRANNKKLALQYGDNNESK